MSKKDATIEAPCQYYTGFAIVFLYLAFAQFTYKHNLFSSIGDVVSCFANIIVIFATYLECRKGGSKKTVSVKIKYVSILI